DAATLQTQPLTRATSLAKKILSDIPAAQQASVTGAVRNCVHTGAHVLTASAIIDVRLSRIVAGLELHRGLLQDLRQLSSSTEELNSLTSLTQLNSPTTKAAFPALSPRLSGDQVQVAIHLSLQQLRSFTQDVFRSLRHIAASN
uniref:Uncharacterized protein n=1 Tax=Sinocyclocheilus rhinocerous TaxID=307959 RepID=A0A673MW85_9TELE